MADLSPHTSMFSYSITRPYPFRWLTPTIFVVGILASILFSFINFATSGYNMITITTPDPNTTIANVTNFQNWPSFLTSKIRPTCEPKALTVNGDYYTNNTILSYRLLSITHDKETNGITYADTPYLNNPLTDCSILEVSYHYKRNEQIDHIWTVDLVAYVTCAINGDAGRDWINMSTTYGASTEMHGFGFYNSNPEKKASFWWGESILNWHQKKVIFDTFSFSEEVMENDKDFFTKTGIVKFFPLPRITEVDQYKSNTSWLVDITNCYVLPLPKLPLTWVIWECKGDVEYPQNMLHEYGLDSDMAAKVFHSIVMADLGQSSLNILNNPELLEYFTKDYDPFFDFIGSSLGLWMPSLAKEPYMAANASQWDLHISPSVLATTYLCQVPQLKSTGTLIFSVLIANLVLLQALWKIFILCTDFFVTRKHPEMNSCLGCQMNNITTESNIELGEYNCLGQENTTEGPANMRTESVANEIKIEERDRLVQEQSGNKDSREELLRLDESQRL
ncbi:hypothetical protein BS50DRAFT_674934 [Corynespora cassiicola Philippines]|uniref:Transmembrane protein n=1 Tax=Corynespora cassiicola Philippines TaxID=1448308 RepID=A0A2T2NT31_CORCC|nr:hypothetical protein BS50DRAFT_674934 [Corynespora cassiicola Philippines]